jgi:hypothetical protein
MGEAKARIFILERFRFKTSHCTLALAGSRTASLADMRRSGARTNRTQSIAGKRMATGWGKEKKASGEPEAWSVLRTRGGKS